VTSKRVKKDGTVGEQEYLYTKVNMSKIIISSETSKPASSRVFYPNLRNEKYAKSTKKYPEILI